jgi:HEAT repeat protein
VLGIIRDGRGTASWHSIARKLPSLDVPLAPSYMVVLQDVRARGLAIQQERPGGMDAWTITAAGEAWLDGASTPGPLSSDEVEKLSAALRSDAVTSTRALVPLVGDGLRMWAALRQVLAADPSLAEAVASAALFMPQSERGPFARELLDDPRAAVRAALFRAWTPVQKDVPGRPLPTVSDDELDELLRRGLLDPSLDVREAAATLAFLAERGAQLVGELVTNLESPAAGVAWWSVLALGAARDPLSRELLEARLGSDDRALASAAVRALGARPDGHTSLLRALHDARSEVVEAAIFALSTVVRDLSPEELGTLDADPRPPVRGALAAYRARS